MSAKQLVILADGLWLENIRSAIKDLPTNHVFEVAMKEGRVRGITVVIDCANSENDESDGDIDQEIADLAEAVNEQAGRLCSPPH